MALEKCGLSLDRSHKELTPHGTPSFPCAGYLAVYGAASEEADVMYSGVIPWHWHKEIELLYLAEGSLVLQLPGKQVELQKGDCYFINSNVMHEASANPNCELWSIVFHPLLVSGGDHTVYAQKYIEPVTGCSLLDGCLLAGDMTGDKIENRKKSMIEDQKISDKENQEAQDFKAAFQAICREQEGYEFVVREKLSAICLSVYCRNQTILGREDIRLDPNRERMRRMLDYIHTNYAQDIDLAGIAKTADIGERECLRCFQKMMQVSPMQYLIKYRVTQASAMLQQNVGESIADISLRCGFDSPSHFSQMFRRYYQCTPREYRQRLK